MRSRALPVLGAELRCLLISTSAAKGASHLYAGKIKYNKHIIMVYCASWQHKLKTHIHKITTGNEYRKQILTYTCNHTLYYKHAC